MTVFTELPDAITIVRTAVALVAFGFAPGYLVALGRRKAKRAFSLLSAQPAESVFEGVIISFAIMAFAAILLMFSIGYSSIALFALEAIALVGAWFYWQKNA